MARGRASVQRNREKGGGLFFTLPFNLNPRLLSRAAVA